MVLSRNRIKYIRSLKIKKYRDIHKQFIAEGEKIISDCIACGSVQIEQLIATKKWLADHKVTRHGIIKEITEVTGREFSQISSMDSPTGVMAIINIPQMLPDDINASEGLSLVLDNIQDPGNLGTIIRTASWFGIRAVFCSLDCADCYNPKVVQASMGAVLYTRVVYAHLPELLKQYAHLSGITVYGTFMSGNSIWDEKPGSNAMFVFGNESKGISNELIPFINVRLHIPRSEDSRSGSAESLNVASAVAIVCAAFTR